MSLRLTFVILALSLTAQTQVLPARDLAPILDVLGALPGNPVKFDRSKVEQGYMADVYSLVQNVNGLAVYLDLHGEGKPEDRARLHDFANKLDQHLRALLARNETRLRNPDRDNLARYADSDRTIAPPAAGEQRVVFLGDSITDGWRLQDYFVGKPYVNRGIGGQITGEMLGRMKADVLDLKPAVMVLLAGTNDLARGVTIPAIENNLYMIADLAKSHGIKVVLSSIMPVNGNNIAIRPPDKILELNKYIQDLCAKEGYVYLDYHTALKNSEGLIPKELAADGLHPNADGYKICAPLAQAAIDKALASSSTSKVAAHKK